MTLERYWSILIKQWQLVVICFVLMGTAAFFMSHLMTPIYSSTAVVQIAIRTGNNQADYNNLLASDQLVQTEAQLAVSDPVLRQVASDFPGLTADDLAREVSSTPKLNTQLFEITVLDSSPTVAANIANDIASTLIKQQIQVVQQDNSQSQQQIQQELDKTSKQIDTISNEIAALQAKGANSAQLVVLQSQLSGLQQHYTQWQTVLAQLELTEAQSGDFLRMAQAAQPEFRPVRPNILLNTAAGLVGGLFLGMLIAVLFDQLDTHVRTAEDISALLDWPVIGTVWRTNSANKSEVINPQGHNANSESYRILRTNVGFSGIDNPLQSLMVTSAMPGDGKSTVAANLAIFMAKAGKNILLVDADLRRPTQHQIFGLTPDKKGLSNAVLAFSSSTGNTSHFPQFIVPSSPPRATGADAINRDALNRAPTVPNFSLEQFMHEVGIPNLRVMPSGPLPPNPSELLDSKAMQRLFMALTSSGAEIVIFDAPPLRGLSDASILASKVDGTLIVVDVTRANRLHLKQMKAVLSQAGAHVLGCVINKQRRSRHDTSYSYYYYGRNQSGSYSQDEQVAENKHGVADARSSSDPAKAFNVARNAVVGAIPGHLAEGKKGGHPKNGH